MRLRPVTFREACAFVDRLHRHHSRPRGHKFSIGAEHDGALVGVAMVGRPIARALDDGFTAEITRVCTDGSPNACSMLYGGAVRACKAMGYLRVVTYTQAAESGASLRGAGFVCRAKLPARGSWAQSSVRDRDSRDPVGAGGVDRLRWEWNRAA